MSAQEKLAEPQCLCAEQWPGRGHPEDCPVALRIDKLIERAESAEQLLSEMAEGLRALVPSAAWLSDFKDEYAGSLALLAKYDARPKP